jgi:GntR family transcriptional regulator
MQNFEIESVDQESSVPLYLQAEQILRRFIRKPEYSDGISLLPNEIDLADAIGVSRSTMREAMNKLVFEGLLIRKKGLGTRVAESQVITKASFWYEDPSEFYASDLKPDVLEINLDWEKAPRPVARFYDIPEKRSVIKLERLVNCKDTANVFIISWLNPRQGFKPHMDFEGTSVYKLLTQSGVKLGIAREEITARIPEPWVYKKLDVKPGSIVMYRRRFVYDIDNKPVEYRLEMYDAAKFVIEYELSSP